MSRAVALEAQLRRLDRNTRIAVIVIEEALVAYGTCRHPLVDALLDVRNTLLAA